MKALPKGVGAVLASFLRACDDTLVVVYGPYPPCEGRTRWRLQVYDPATKRKQNLTAESEEAARALIPLLEIEFKRHSPFLLHEVLAQYLEYKATIAQSQWVSTLGERLRSFLPNVPVQRLMLEDAESLYENETKVSIARGKSKNAKRSLELFADVAVLLWRHCQGRPGEQRVFAAALQSFPPRGCRELRFLMRRG